MNISPIASYNVRSNHAKAQSFKGTTPEEINNPNTANIIDVGAGGRIGKNYLYAYIIGKHAPINHSRSSQALAPIMADQNLAAANMGSMKLKAGKTIADVKDEDLLAQIANDSILPELPPTIDLSIKRNDGKTFLHISSERAGEEDIELVATRDDVDFSNYKPDVLINCTGAKNVLSSDGLRSHKAAYGLSADGYALLSAPSKDKTDDMEKAYMEKNMPMAVYGVTDNTPENKKVLFDKIAAAGNVLSGASCTTNGMAVATQIIHENFGIKKGIVGTIHAATGTQSLVDITKAEADSKNGCSLDSAIPTTTGAAKALAKVIPGFDGKLDGIAWRVPISAGSIAEADFLLNKETTAADLNKVLVDASQDPKNKWLIGIAPKNSTTRSVVFNPVRDLINTQATKVVGGDFAHVESYYDNEWGYTVGLAGLATMLAKEAISSKAAKTAMKAVVK